MCLLAAFGIVSAVQVDRPLLILWPAMLALVPMLVRNDAPKESLVVTGARVVDPVEGVDARIDVRVDDGVIAQLGTAVGRNGHRILWSLSPSF